MGVKDSATAVYQVTSESSARAREVPRGYKRTDVGVIPQDWILRRLDEISAFITKGATPTTYGFEWQQSGILFLRSECVAETGLNLAESMLISDAAYLMLQRSHINIGDLLVTITGNVGRVVRYQHTEPAAINQHIARVRVSADDVAPNFVFYWLSQSSVRSTYNSITTGQAYPQISLTQVRETQVGLPPTKIEQEAIAEALGDADMLIESLQQLIAKKRAIKQGAMQALLTGRQRLPGFTGEWQILSMSEKSSLKARIGWQGLTTAEYLRTGDFYLVTGTDFEDGKILWSNCCFVNRWRYEQDKNIQLQPRDILLTKDGTIGKVAYINELPGLATLNSGVFVIRPMNDAYDSRFFYYVLMSGIFVDFLMKLQAGSTISHLYQKDLVNFSFLAPPSVKEQTAIAAVLSDMDAEIEALEARLAKTRALKAGMMQALLTGRIRLV